ncbi:MAG: CRISPR-associated endoribonuclease Cas6 [Clostridia bacterium]|nr:CRISPR-associated endoribonuclease Cas6 [Clostridia bacterium]
MNLSRHFIKIVGKESYKMTYNYQYNLMKLIYRALEVEDKKQAKYLHEKGHIVDNKKFKLLNTYLLFSDVIFEKDYIDVCKGKSIELMISGDEDYINLILKGLIKLKEICICDCIFEIIDVRADKKIKFKKQMLYKILSQVIESTYNDRIKYLSPYDMQFYSALAHNLKRKYRIVFNEEYKDEIYFDIENVLTIKKKKIKNIKGKGYKTGYGNFNIWIEASRKMQKVVYYTGLGQANLLGAGTLIHLTSN